MIIQHNIPALNSYRNYNSNVSALAKNLEKLSSGYRINSAGDDAAGLAISEKMRAQITGLDAAQKNVKDGTNLVKTAEGSLQEVQDMMNRMVYLATQSANGTYDNEVDRANLQKEVQALKDEINRIADSANFNGQKLLDGSLEKKLAGSKAYSFEGMDRILSGVIGEGENPYDVAGEKTVLDTSAQTKAKAKFEVDLTTLKMDVRTDASTATTQENVGNFTLKVGDWSVTTNGMTVDGSAGNSSDASVGVDALVDNIITQISTAAVAAGKANNVVTINGVDWTVTDNGNKLTFEQVSEPQNMEEAQANFDVSVALDPASKNTTLSGSIDPGTTVLTEGVPTTAAVKANTIFKITADDIVDGATIKIADKTVILKVGAESTTVTGSANAVVDLTNMEEGDIDLNDALAKISKAFGANVTDSKAAEANGTKITGVTLDVGVSDGTDGFPTGLTVQRSDTGTKAAYTTKEKLASIFEMNYTKSFEATDALTLQIGDTSDSYNQIQVSIQDMHTGSLGLDDVDISTQAGAQAAIDKIKNAINTVSSTRGDLGALQNRLDHTSKNLSIMEENITNAESNIRDTDIAEEMMAYTKNNILVQSAQAMLAQANMLPQGVLQLLG